VGLDIHINQVIVGVSEGLGYVGAEFAIPRVRRRMTSFVGMGLSSLLCFVLAFIPIGSSIAWNVVSVVFLFAMRFVLSMFWAIFYVYLAEIFPTRIRSLAFGWASALGTIGSAASPYIRQISDSIGLSSWIIPGVFGLFSTACIFPLTETFGMGMEEEIEELKPKEEEVDYETYVVSILENGDQILRRDSKGGLGVSVGGEGEQSEMPAKEA
jgi:OCT family organic cation transporter-like MFS transporter 16